MADIHDASQESHDSPAVSDELASAMKPELAAKVNDSDKPSARLINPNKNRLPALPMANNTSPLNNIKHTLLNQTTKTPLIYHTNQSKNKKHKTKHNYYGASSKPLNEKETASAPEMLPRVEIS